MLIVFGWGHQKRYDFGPVAMARCEHCGNNVGWRLLEVSVWFSLFFVPVFPYSRRRFLLCPICSYGLELTTEQFRTLRDGPPLTPSAVFGYPRLAQDRKHAALTDADKALLHAAAKGDVSAAEELLDHGVFVDVQDTNSATPLHMAARSGFPLMVQLLLDRGADVNARDCNDNTAMTWALKYGRDEVADILTQYGGKW